MAIERRRERTGEQRRSRDGRRRSIEGRRRGRSKLQTRSSRSIEASTRYSSLLSSLLCFCFCFFYICFYSRRRSSIVVDRRSVSSLPCSAYPLRNPSVPMPYPNVPDVPDPLWPYLVRVQPYRYAYPYQVRTRYSYGDLSGVPVLHRRVITTISLNLQDCGGNKACKGLYGKKFLASMNNQSFVRPTMSILECHYRNLKTSAYAYNFPEKPPHSFNYTGVNPLTQNMNTEFGTRLLVVPYGTKLEIVLQDTSFLNVENHPIHVHGHNFFVVGTGFGNFDDVKDPGRYNLVDPPERNTVAVPSGGWAAIRINADNPGVWFIHCHLEAHTSWGLATGLVVENGPHPSQRLLPPPEDLPSC